MSQRRSHQKMPLSPTKRRMAELSTKTVDLGNQETRRRKRPRKIDKRGGGSAFVSEGGSLIWANSCREKKRTPGRNCDEEHRMDSGEELLFERGGRGSTKTKEKGSALSQRLKITEKKKGPWPRKQ